MSLRQTQDVKHIVVVFVSSDFSIHAVLYEVSHLETAMKLGNVVCTIPLDSLDDCNNQLVKLLEDQTSDTAKSLNNFLQLFFAAGFEHAKSTMMKALAPKE